MVKDWKSTWGSEARTAYRKGIEKGEKQQLAGDIADLKSAGFHAAAQYLALGEISLEPDMWKVEIIDSNPFWEGASFKARITKA